MRTCIAFVALAATCLAQTGSGTLSGKIAGAGRITVLQGGREVRTGVADQQGNFRLPLPPGEYFVRVEKTTRRVTISGGKNTTLNFDQPEFFDEPQFTVAGVTDNTYRGGHGSDSVLRSSETLTKATASLGDGGRSRAELEEAGGHPLKAVQEFQKAAETDPSEANLFNWGTELLSHKAAEAAAEVFTKGCRLHPQSYRMLLGLASSWYATGSYQKAAECFFAAVDMNPDDPNAYAFLMKAQSNEITQAPGYQERFARFVKAHPGSALANYYDAMSLWRGNGDAEGCLGYLQVAVRLDTQMAEAFLQMGIVYTVQSNYPAAIKALEQALAENPSLEEAHYRLSEAYRLTGNGPKAQQELETFQKLSKQSADQLERERREVQQFVIALKKTDAQKE